MEPTAFIPTQIQYQFNNLKSIHIYSNCFYNKFKHLFASCLPSLQDIHISDLHVDDFDDDSDDIPSRFLRQQIGLWRINLIMTYIEGKKQKKTQCLIHLL